MIIAAGTIVSSLQSSPLTARFGTGRVTAFSVLLTAAALLGLLTGAALAQALRARRLEPEMQTGTLLLAMTSLADAADALDNLAEALAEAEAETRANSPLPPVATALPAPGAAVLPIAAALRRPHAPCPAAAAADRTAAEYVWAYPPGVPLLAPGERITPAFLAAADALEAAGTRLHHTVARTPGTLAVLADPDPAAPGTR